MGDAPRSDPSSAPRIGYGGAAPRARPLFSEHRERWKVEVMPLELARGVKFEVRAEFEGQSLPGFEFSRSRQVKRIEQDHFEDRELAEEVARRAAAMLQAGERDLFLPRIAEEARRRR